MNKNTVPLFITQQTKDIELVPPKTTSDIATNLVDSNNKKYDFKYNYTR